MNNLFLLISLIVFSVIAPSTLFAQSETQGELNVKIEEVVSGLEEPWSLGFIDEGFLITERGGRLIWFNKDRQAIDIKNIPNTKQGGQAGLFDILIPENYSTNHEIFLSYASPDDRGTAVIRARLNLNEARLDDVEQIFLMNSPSRSNIHFGGRMVDADSEHIFLTLGERGDGPLAQDMSVDNGSVVRIKKDGSGYEIWSKGHRNPQGAALDANGQLFITEHGAMGGDELNAIARGNNYGWPVISYGLNYDGSKIGEGQAKSGLEQPKIYWDPSIAPSGLAIHSGNNWPEMRGKFFVGSLKFDQIAVVEAGAPYQQIATIMTDQTLRVRDVREAPDGSVWFLSVINGAAYRILPITQ